MSHRTFKLGLTADFYQSDGTPLYSDFGLSCLQSHPAIHVSRLDRGGPQIESGQLAPFHGVIVLSPKVTAESLAGADNLLAIGRFGVGYDSVDVSACTGRGILLFITPGAVDRPVAEATICWMLALSHRVLQKDSLVRKGGWNRRSHHMGTELRDRTIGLVGFGGIARAVSQLLRAFSPARMVAFDPFADAKVAFEHGVGLVPLDELLSISDFVSIHCPLNEQTRGLIGDRELKRMKPDAFLINTARGGIVHEASLLEALQGHRIAGAALDCFDIEPLPAGHAFTTLENVLLAPHSIAWTHELFRDIGRAACQGMIDLSIGSLPKGVVNSEVLNNPQFQAKWRQFQS